MPDNSAGVHSLPSGYLAVTGQTIQASQHNPPLEDISTALTARVSRSGAAPMTGNLQMGGFKVTGAADGSADSDLATVGQVPDLFAPGIADAASKTTPVNADSLPLTDSAASNVLKKLTWANLKATLKTYFDTLYVPVARTVSGAGLASGGGALSANQTITVTAANQTQAEAGTDNTVAMTPLRTAQAIAALATTSTDADGIGTSVLAYTTDGATSFGQTRAGSTLRLVVNNPEGLVTDANLTGTWRSMGESAGATPNNSVIWMKVSD